MQRDRKRGTYLPFGGLESKWNFTRRMKMLVLKFALAAMLVVMVPPLLAASCLRSISAIQRFAKTDVPKASQSSQT
jgi:hypothetical protein